MLNQSDYIEKYVCFIDILGFTQRVEDSVLSGALVQSIHEALTSMDESASRKDVFLKKLYVSNFSDSIAISCDITEINLNLLLTKVMGLQQKLLSISPGYVCRGAITKGKIYHEKNKFFGPAQNQAADMEKNVAIYPRVICSHEVAQDALNSLYKDISKKIIKSDEKGIFYIDYIGHLSIYTDFSKIKSFLMEEYMKSQSIKDLEKRKNIQDKYDWAIQQFNIRLREEHKNRFIPVSEIDTSALINRLAMNQSQNL